MGTIDKAKHRKKQIQYDLKGNKYNSCAKRLREYSSQAAGYISRCEEKLRDINVTVSDSSGDVINNFQDGINNYKSKIQGMINEAYDNKNKIDAAINEAVYIANKYYMLADAEERKWRD